MATVSELELQHLSHNTAEKNKFWIPGINSRNHSSQRPLTSAKAKCWWKMLYFAVLKYMLFYLFNVRTAPPQAIVNERGVVVEWPLIFYCYFFSFRIFTIQKLLSPKNLNSSSLSTGTFLVGCVAQLAERRSLAGELTLSCVRSAVDGWPLCG